MPSIVKGTRSYRKIAIEQETNLIGYKKTVFAHKAAGGETGITISSLTLPTEMTGFTNPSFNEIVSANMKLFRNNVRITSSLRGTLIDYLSYNIPIKERIDWVGFTAEAGEIFVVEIDPNNRLSPQVVDAAPLVATGTLAAGVTDFSVGASFEVNKYPAAQIGAVLVFLDGQLQFRNTGNATAAPSADGNYQEVDSGVGFGTIIRFNLSDVAARSVVVVSNGLLVEKPNESQMSEIEKVQGQVDKLIQTTAALAGVPTTDFQAAPSQVQLQQFGDRVIALETPASGGSTGIVYYQQGNTSMALQGNLGGALGTPLIVEITRIGRVVTLTLPPLRCTPTGSSTRLVTSTDLPSWAIPSTGIQSQNVSIRDNNNVVSQPGAIIITSTGQIQIIRDTGTTAWTNSAQAGVQETSTVSYNI